eukprot:4628766-Amphidinium_carterae.1
MSSVDIANALGALDADAALSIFRTIAGVCMEFIPTIVSSDNEAQEEVCGSNYGYYYLLSCNARCSFRR